MEVSKNWKIETFKEIEIQEKNRTDHALVWTLSSLASLLFFLASSILAVSLKIDFLSRISFLGLATMFIPVVVFQYNLFAGLSSLKLELSDLKSVWFWFFNLMFLFVDALIYLSINMVFVAQGFGTETLLPGASLNDYLVYMVTIYVVIVGAGLIYRHKHKPYVMRIA